jgi:hypothetical protein
MIVQDLQKDKEERERELLVLQKTVNETKSQVVILLYVDQYNTRYEAEDDLSLLANIVKNIDALTAV